MSEYMSKLKMKLLERANIEGAGGVLSWDQQTNMPRKGSKARGMQLSTLGGISHTMLISDEMSSLINKLREDSEYTKLSEDDKVIVDRVYEDYEKSKKIPVELVVEITKASTEAYSVWEEAREKSDFKVFQPHLKKIVDYSKQLADIFGYEEHPYDALLDNFEKGLTVSELDPMFVNLRDKTVPFLEAIQNSEIKTNMDILKKHYPKDKQWTFTIDVLKKIGYDFDAGRQDLSTHPFTIGLHPHDVRVTTRIDENFVADAISSSVHEGGHALYEQGLLPDYYGTPLCAATSLGVHESQSRLWENMVGKSKAFWIYFYPKLQKLFPENLKSVSFDDFYKSFNHIEPGFIRVDADKITYNLHIIVRYEIERDVIAGNIDVKDFPEIWNEKMKKYLGITPPNDSKGVLQDVHWSSPMGYFPTYTLGNLYSAQLYHKALEEIDDLESKYEKGDFSPLLTWLRDKVHKHGRKYYPKDLIKEATGEEPTSAYFIDHIYDRYGEIYQIARMMM